MTNAKIAAKIAYVVWKDYQRRAEVFASRIDAKLEFMPHRFQPRLLRGIDYLLKLAATLTYLLREKPDAVIFQAPPLLPAIPALLLGVPYIIDAHNAMIQGFWRRLPFSQFIFRWARLAIVHNEEVLALAGEAFPQAKFISILDPIEPIVRPVRSRPDDQIEHSAEHHKKHQILIICSFASDEPIDVIIEVIQQLPDYQFVITANLKKLPLDQQQALQQCPNLQLTGFLPTAQYQEILCASLAALVLTTRSATQPSGACEALAADIQLILSRTALTEQLFGDWAVLVDNSAESIGSAIRGLECRAIDWSVHRKQWNDAVSRQIQGLYDSIHPLCNSSRRSSSDLSRKDRMATSGETGVQHERFFSKRQFAQKNRN